MKKIHPRYGLSQVTCTCGNNFRTRSTAPNIRVEVCAVCHPFYNHRPKVASTGDRSERFRRRAARSIRGRSR